MSSALYLPIALWRPDLLLIFGPLVFGYPHLLASYRLAPGGARASFAALAAITAASMGANQVLRKLGWLPEMPFGAWEALVAAAAVALFYGRVKSGAVCAAVGFLLWKLSWREPLVFAATSLLLHNWVALAVWLRRARSAAGRSAALAAAAVFGLIHGLVFAGYADFLMPSSSAGILTNAAAQTGALLAPWSTDLAMWYRAVVLYTFGLSLHYYVWLKAIPECEGRVPLSFRRTSELLARDLGRPALFFAIAVAGAGICVWLAAPELGARSYFRIATLHGWFELLFLVAGIRIDPARVMRSLNIKYLAQAQIT